MIDRHLALAVFGSVCALYPCNHAAALSGRQAAGARVAHPEHPQPDEVRYRVAEVRQVPRRVKPMRAASLSPVMSSYRGCLLNDRGLVSAVRIGVWGL